MTVVHCLILLCCNSTGADVLTSTGAPLIRSRYIERALRNADHSIENVLRPGGNMRDTCDLNGAMLHHDPKVKTRNP